MPEKDYSATPPKKLGAKPGVGVIVHFTTSLDDLERRSPRFARHADPADGLWIAWPKKASKLETDLDFATVQKVGLDSGLVDNKSASVDDAWQALRFVGASPIGLAGALPALVVAPDQVGSHRARRRAPARAGGTARCRRRGGASA